MNRRILSVDNKKDAKVLRRSSKSLLSITQEAQETIIDMIDTMAATQEAIGLAAPQIGKRLRIITIKLNKWGHALTVVNPVFLPQAGLVSVSDSEEACLSVPGRSGIVSRYYSGTLHGRNMYWNEIRFPVSGLGAFVVQHEIDHLDGVLYIDRLKA